MKWLKEEDSKNVKETLDALKNAVTIIFFTQEIECSFCRETREVLTEISELSENVTLKTYNFVMDELEAKKYGVDKIPAIIITDAAGKDYGIHFYGIPAGYEFVSLLSAIKVIGNEETGLQKQTLDKISTINEPIHIQVFVTPTCPYCPTAVETAHKLAYQSDYIKADMVEASEFAPLTNKYNVFGVPKIIVNETTHFEGALPEAMFIDGVIKALQDKPKPSLKDKLKKIVSG
ncbi:thioredoxin family protein [candidate division CSSED10-310 bacterium]|uniref:Thioredoxin family protein n=1 Tax=candidate division CSSED10-310 bacterium TaxID=2855610 RepID=A0ABV6YWG0_UNCC1